MADSPSSEAPPADNPVTVLNTWAIYSDAPNAFYKSFIDEALPLLEQRRAVVDRLNSRVEWERYREEARRKVEALIGVFPEKTPLKARTIGVVEKPGFRMEKVIFESLPGFHVTAACFIPAGLKGKAPAILYCSGHSDSGFRSPPYQTMILNLVKKGFVVLAFDPIGQGERLQYVDPATGRSAFGAGPVREHSRAGTQAFLLGTSLAHQMIWDGIRSIDYLLTRPEVDSARLGITGRSGGGTQAAYIAALDDRILASAPENYLTTFEHLLKTRGPQDPEQNFYGALARGFDQADLLISRAPKPALVVATTRDIFSIHGTQALYAEARRSYTAFGESENLEMTVDDAEHTSTRKNREATYAFFRKHLNLPGTVLDEDVERLSREELRITETGQVVSSLKGETTTTINGREAERLDGLLEKRRLDLAAHLAVVKKDAALLSGYVPPKGDQPVVFSGRFVRNGYALEKYLLPVDSRYAVPVLMMVPDTTSSKVVLYLHPGGKSSQMAVDGEMEWLVKQGCTVVAPDLIGMGELSSGIMGGPAATPPRLWYAYVLLGKSMLGRQLVDLDRVIDFAGTRFNTERNQIYGVAHGALGPLLLHANAFRPLERIAVIGAPLSYRSMAMTAAYAAPFVHALVPSALTRYDLPDLAAVAAPSRLLVLDPRNGMGTSPDETELAKDSAVIVRAFEMQASRPQFQIVRGDKAATLRAIENWLR